jgi:biotin transport system substrate-specific component
MSTQQAATATAPRAVLADLLPGELVRDVLLVLGGACFTGLMAQISIKLPWTPVPLTGQTLAVLCVGAALGPVRGGASMILYALAGIAGVPWFAGGESGWGGPAFGYVLGFIVSAIVVGALAERGADRTPIKAVPAMLLGTVIIYAIGVPWLAASLDVSLSKAFELGVRPFIGGDLIKLALAAGLLPAAWKLAGPRKRS